MAQRISRAKQRIRASGLPFRMPAEPERTRRLSAVLHVLYLIFTEGYASTSGPSLYRGELSAGQAGQLLDAWRRILDLALTEYGYAARCRTAGQVWIAPNATSSMACNVATMPGATCGSFTDRSAMFTVPVAA